MDKSPEAFRTISEVAEALDVPPHVLRFWETRFTQVKPVKRGGGRRYYRPEDVRLLRGIRGLLYDDGMTIKGVQKILRERGIRHVIGLGTAAEPGEPEVAARPRRPPRRPRRNPPRSQRRSRRPGAAPRRRPPARPAPQPDLFAPAGGGATTTVDAPAARAEAAALRRAARQAALRSLLAELQALRAVMIKDRPADDGELGASLPYELARSI